LIIEPVAAGIATLDLQVTSLGDEKLVVFGTVGAFEVGDSIIGSVSLTTADVTAVNATSITIDNVVGAGFQIGENIAVNPAINLTDIQLALPVGVFSVGDSVTAGGATGDIRTVTGVGPTSILVEVTAGVFPGVGPLTDTTSGATATITSSTVLGNATATIASITPPSNLLKAEVYRNGMLLAEGAGYDYTLDYTTGILTLVLPTVSGSERFVILRESIPIGDLNVQHQHLKLPIPIIINGTVNLDMQLTVLNPTPNKLLDVDLYRNGLLQAIPDDYVLDLNTGIVTLVTPANAGELFIAIRQVV
jgi:hypothetical protein